MIRAAKSDFKSQQGLKPIGQDTALFSLSEEITYIGTIIVLIDAAASLLKYDLAKNKQYV